MGERAGVSGIVSPLNVVLVPLHSHPDLITSCAELLNQTWRRSIGARMHSLEHSSDEFPVCLVLIGDPKGPVLGHARLCKVIGLPDSLFVESVVVSVELRGKGYGRKLMDATERYARNRGFHNLHLTTHDKQDFYHHLGYQLAEPVQSMGTLGSLLPINMLQHMSNTKKGLTTSQSSHPDHSDSVINSAGSAPAFLTSPSVLEPSVPLTSPSIHMSSVPPPAPPPPPPPLFPLSSPHTLLSPPPSLSSVNSALTSSPDPSISSHHAHLQISPPGSIQMAKISPLQTAYRDFRGQPLFWMKKGI